MHLAGRLTLQGVSDSPPGGEDGCNSARWHAGFEKFPADPGFPGAPGAAVRSDPRSRWALIRAPRGFAGTGPATEEFDVATQHSLRRPELWRISALALLALPLGAQEVQIPCATGQTPICPGEWASCSISPATDIDVYQFFATAGDRYRVTIDGNSNDFDPRIEVFDSTGQVVGTNTCFAAQFATCSVALGFDTADSSLYSIVVTDAGSDNAGNYTMDFQKLVPSKNTVPVLGYGSSKTNSLGHGADHDWYRFEMAQGTRLRIAVDGKSNDLDPKIEVWFPDGSYDSASCSASQFATCSAVLDIPSAPADGWAYVAFSDAGNNNAGTIDITLSCILGTCPPNLPPSSIGLNYCVGNVNSTGGPALMSASGSDVVGDNDVHLLATGAPTAKFGIFFMGAASTNIPLAGSQGQLCVIPPIRRFPVQYTCNDGSMHLDLDLMSPGGGPPFQAGETWYFQAWYRDQNPGPSNTTDGLAVTFQ